jgi:hypothetical protein
MYLYDLEKPETFGIPNRVLRNTGWNRIPLHTSTAQRPTPKLQHYKKFKFYKGVTTYLMVKFVAHFMGKYEAWTEWPETDRQLLGRKRSLLSFHVSYELPVGLTNSGDEEVSSP